MKKLVEMCEPSFIRVCLIRFTKRCHSPFEIGLGIFNREDKLICVIMHDKKVLKSVYIWYEWQDDRVIGSKNAEYVIPCRFIEDLILWLTVSPEKSLILKVNMPKEEI